MSSRYNQLFLNCPVCKHGTDVADNEWLAICCPNCKIDIQREDWINRDVLEGQFLDSLEAAQPTLAGGRLKLTRLMNGTEVDEVSPSMYREKTAAPKA